jgi:hypothetical protein
MDSDKIDFGKDFRLTADHPIFLNKQAFESVIVGIKGKPILRPKEETGFRDNSWDCQVELEDGTELVWGFSKTNLMNIVKAYGEHGKDWIGKRIKLTKVPQPKAKSGFALAASPIDEPLKVEVVQAAKK